MKANGDIYARGAQDTKNAGMLYLEAIRNLKQQAFVPTSTIHVTFTPDEEVGGAEGFGAFANSTDFADLNVGIALDEGGVTATAAFTLYNQDNTGMVFNAESVGAAYAWSVLDRKRDPGESVHQHRSGQSVPPGAAGEEEARRVHGLRHVHQSHLPQRRHHHRHGFDIRLDINENTKAILQRVGNEWAAASRNMTHEFVIFNDILEPSVAKASNPFWSLLKEAVESSGHTLSDAQVVPAFTDARFLRARNIPAFNFAPVSHTPNRYHADNEFMNAAVCLSGIPVYESVLRVWAQFTGHYELRAKQHWLKPRSGAGAATVKF